MNDYRRTYYWMWRYYITIKLVHLVVFDFEVVTWERNLHDTRIEKRNLNSSYIKAAHRILSKVLVGAMNAASNNIWKSKLYIYADGQ